MAYFSINKPMKGLSACFCSQPVSVTAIVHKTWVDLGGQNHSLARKRWDSNETVEIKTRGDLDGSFFVRTCDTSSSFRNVFRLLFGLDYIFYRLWRLFWVEKSKIQRALMSRRANYNIWAQRSLKMSRSSQRCRGTINLNKTEGKKGALCFNLKYLLYAIFFYRASTFNVLYQFVKQRIDYSNACKSFYFYGMLTHLLPMNCLALILLVFSIYFRGCRFTGETCSCTA